MTSWREGSRQTEGRVMTSLEDSVNGIGGVVTILSLSKIESGFDRLI